MAGSVFADIPPRNNSLAWLQASGPWVSSVGFLPLFRTGSNISPRRCPEPLQTHQEAGVRDSDLVGCSWQSTASVPCMSGFLWGQTPLVHRDTSLISVCAG